MHRRSEPPKKASLSFPRTRRQVIEHRSELLRDVAKPIALDWARSTTRAFTTIRPASTILNIGTAMFHTGSAWLMTSLSADPTAVSLVQVAANWLIVLLMLPACPLADTIDSGVRRRSTHTNEIHIAAARPGPRPRATKLGKSEPHGKRGDSRTAKIRTRPFLFWPRGNKWLPHLVSFL
jgi:hypothetical protein